MIRISMRTLTEWKRMSAVVLVCAGMSVLVPIWLLLAHFNQGADFPSQTAVFSLGIFACFVALLFASRFEHITLPMAAIAAWFLAWLLLGLFGNWPQARAEIQALAAAGAIAGTGYIIGSQSRSLSLVWNTLIWTLLLFTLLAFYFHFGQAGNASGSTDGRLTAGFGSPNTAAALFGLSMLIAGSKILMRLQDRKMARLTRSDRINYLAQSEYASIGLLILAGTCLILTISRAGIFISLLCLITLSGFELYRVYRRGRFSFLRRKRVLIPLGGFILLIVFLALSGEINPNEITNLSRDLEGRQGLFSIYWNLWLEKPITGHGLGSFNSLNDAATTLDKAGAMVPVGSAHNVVLQWLVQQGVVGLMIITGILAVILAPTVRALMGTSKAPRHFQRLVLAITALLLIHGMVDYALEIPSVMWTFAFLLGLSAGHAVQLKSQTQVDEEYHPSGKPSDV